MSNSQQFKQARTLKENLGKVLYALQYLKVDGVDLAQKLKVDGNIKLSAEGDVVKEDVTNLRTALALSDALVSMTENIATPRNSGVSGAIYQAEQNNKKQ
tara:strand:+ start:1769 stop:2068 length:300 start_codon:yes stop_codon:yes gene_type:complete